VKCGRIVAIVFLLSLWTAPACIATSIVFPAFSAPIIHHGRAYFSHMVGKRVICFDLKARAIVWHRDLDFLVYTVFLSPSGGIVALGDKRAEVLDSLKGATISSSTDPRWRSAIDSRGRMFLVSGSLVRCVDWESGRQSWEFDTKYEYGPSVQVADGIVFALLSPRALSMSSGQPMRITDGKSEVFALRAENGALLWKEQLPLNHSGFASQLHVKPGKREVACATSNVLRFLDPATGKIVRQYKTDSDICDVDWWGDSRLVLCLGNIGTEQKTIRVIGTDDLRTKSEFSIEATEAAQTEIVGDVLLVGSLYRNRGIDLREKRQVWESFQRHQTVHEGLIYYGEPSGDQDKGSLRVFGTCDPKTGRTTVLYQESVEASTRPRP
jgi:outer membrane protein assembly factor BamB